jgi:hypothetical protein
MLSHNEDSPNIQTQGFNFSAEDGKGLVIRPPLSENPSPARGLLKLFDDSVETEAHIERGSE